MQYFNVLRIENIYPDRSRVGAELGVAANGLIPIEDEVILDDHDFTSFLYYSNQKHIFTLQKSRKPGEWWILKKEEVGAFLQDHSRTWIVKRKETNLPIVGGKGQIVEELNNYEFIRLY